MLGLLPGRHRHASFQRRARRTNSRMAAPYAVGSAQPEAAALTVAEGVLAGEVAGVVGAGDGDGVVGAGDGDGEADVGDGLGVTGGLVLGKGNGGAGMDGGGCAGDVLLGFADGVDPRGVPR